MRSLVPLLVSLTAFVVPSQASSIEMHGDDLQAAVDAAPPYSVVTVDSNRTLLIEKTVVVRKPLTIVGLRARLKPKLGETPILHVRAEEFRMRDFVLEGNADTVPQERRAPLVLIHRGRFVIENGEVLNSSKDGLMITPTAEFGDVEHGAVRNLVGRGIVRDVVSIGGAGDEGLFVRHLLVENIRAYDSSLRGPAEVSDGSEHITIRDVYAENCAYGVDMQDHNRPGQINRHVVLENIRVKNTKSAVRAANHDFGHDGLTIRDVSGEDWPDSNRSLIEIRNTSNVLVENASIYGCTDQSPVLVKNSDNVTLRDVSVIDCNRAGEALLVEDSDDFVLDGLRVSGARKPPVGLRYRISSNEAFGGLQVRGVSAEGVGDAGILLENGSESGSLRSKRLDGNLAVVRDQLQP